MNKILLEEILKSHSISGYERGNYYSGGKTTQDVIIDYTKKLFDYANIPLSLDIDRMNNTTIRIGRGSHKIMLSAHIDEIGLQVSDITTEGLLKMTKIGGIDTKVLPGTIVNVHSSIENKAFKGIIGKEPIHSEESSEKVVSLENLLVDIGFENGEEIKSKIRIGDLITFETPTIMDLGENRICGKALDDKVGCFVLCEVMDYILKNYTSYLNDITFFIVFATQEETGLRGIIPVTRYINPDISIDIDVCVATDEGRGIKGNSIKLGEGVVLNRNTCNSECLVRGMIDAAKGTIKYQLLSKSYGSTNTMRIQTESLSCYTALLSIPLRNMHTPVEIVDYRDIKSCIDLLNKTIQHIKCYKIKFL